MRHVTRLAVAIVVVFAACRENAPVQPREPAVNALIVDGAHSGNPHFFFLPPLVPDPSSFFTAGQFNAHLAPTVEVCQLAGNPALGTTSCASGSLVFGPATMSLDAAHQQYQLNWNTQASALSATAFYRITVRGSARGTALGFLDVDPVLGGMQNLKTGDIVVFQDGRTLPIKVRIENGAFGSTNSNDFVEQVVPNTLPITGFDVTTNTFFAGAHFTTGWIPLDPKTGLPITDQVVVIIERVSAGCLNTPFEQLEGCYRFRTDPDFHTLVPGTDLKFAAKVVAGVCFQFPTEVLKKNYPFELYRSEEIDGVRLATPLLSEEPAPFLNCGSFGPSSASTLGAAFRSGRLGDIAKAGWSALTSGIARIVEPKSLHAVDLGAGGSTDGFSLFGYVRPAIMTTSVNPTTAPAGMQVQASALIQDTHDNALTPANNQLVTFTVTGGTGTVSTATCAEGNSCSATTGSDGTAAVSWRLGPGPNTVHVTGLHVINGAQDLFATGIASVPLSGYQVVSSAVATLAAGNGFDRESVLCPTGTKVFGGGAAVVNEGSANFHTRLQESGPGTVGGGAQDAWLVSIKNFDVNSHDIQVFAVCGNPPPGYTVVSSADIPLASGAFTRQSATCPAGTKVFGGGVTVVGGGTGDFNTRVQESGPGTVNGGAQDVWLVSVKDTDAVAHTVRISAICASQPTGYQVIASDDIALSDVGGASPFNRQSVQCPVGQSILGGGAQVVGENTADFDTRLEESSPGTIGGGAQDVWLASVTNDSPNPHTMAIRAVCATATAAPPTP